jgi:SOS-response transcriptional repressor LexA
MTTKQLTIFKWIKQEAERTKEPVGYKQVTEAFPNLSREVISTALKTLKDEGYLGWLERIRKYSVLRTI